MSYHIKTSASWARKLSTQQLNKGGTRMMTDILRMARQNAPVKTGALRNSGRFQQANTLHWRITFGNNRVPYARLREHKNRLHPNATTANNKIKTYFNL
jgi:hypothetical protein